MGGPASPEVAFAISESPWVHSGKGRPVFTLYSVEWLLSAPVFLALSGCCALRRTASDVAAALAPTGLGVLFAWLALLSRSIALAVLALGFFAWAATHAMRWAGGRGGRRPGARFVESRAPRLVGRRVQAPALQSPQLAAETTPMRARAISSVWGRAGAIIGSSA